MDYDSPRAPRKSDERAAREERLAKALRENLRRRKNQARARGYHPQSQEQSDGADLSGASRSSTSTPDGSKTAN
jgi:hypothetical protein